MIKSKTDYHFYLQEDLRKTGIDSLKLKTRVLDRRYKFYKSLRLTEYYTNCRLDPIGKIFAKILRARHIMLCNKFGWTIPINVFAEGLQIVHMGTIVVSGSAKIGKNCRIHVCTNIGRSWDKEGIVGAPQLGDNVYIAPGAKLFGPICIGNNVAIGANSVVNSSFPMGNCTIAGVPARKVSDKNSEKFIL